MLEYRDKFIKAFKNGTFMSAYDYVLKDVNKFIEEIKSMEEKINLSLFEDCFEYSPVDYAKKLINTKNGGKKKQIVEEAEYKISDLEDRIKTMKKKRKKRQNADETLEIIRKIIDYNKNAKNLFHYASKVDKRKLKPKIEESIAERIN